MLWETGVLLNCTLVGKQEYEKQNALQKKKVISICNFPAFSQIVGVSGTGDHLATSAKGEIADVP